MSDEAKKDAEPEKADESTEGGSPPEADQSPADTSDGKGEKIGKGRKVLIVDDDPGTRELLKGILQKEDFEVMLADNGRVGLQRAQNEKPNIIIVDVLMPEKDGFHLFKELREGEDTDYIPVIIVTVRKNMEDSFMALGADAFITKPVDTAEFLKTVAGLPERKKSPKKEEGEEEGSEEAKDAKDDKEEKK